MNAIATKQGFLMARKIVNRKEKRAELEAAEKAPKKAAKKAVKPATAKPPRKKTAKKVAETRVRLYWGVFNHSMKRVALYDFNQRKQAEKKAEDLSKTSKNPHFVQRVKEAVQDPT
jgi:hypothetical protein